MPAASADLIAFFSSFFAAAINSTNEANKAAGACRLAVYLLKCLWLIQIIEIISFVTYEQVKKTRV